jgi:hypothetical protein
VPCSTERRRTVARNLAVACDGRAIRLLTLTLRTTDAPLPDQLDRLYASFRRLRQTRLLKAAVAGGVYFLELTLGAGDQGWHPHLHVIWEGKYLPHDRVKELWHQITGDSYIVHLQALRSSREAASYVSKYASKVVSAQIVRSPRRFTEAIIALARRRTFHVFGAWSGLHLSRSPDADAGWEIFAPLPEILERARRGDPDAIDAVRWLTGRVPPEPLNVPPEWPGAP